MFELKTITIYALVFLLIALVVLAIFFGFKERPASKVELEFWGFDEEKIYKDLIKEFRQKYPYIEIKYSQKKELNYEKELLEAMAIGQGPDIFVIHRSWLAQYQNKISPAPPSLIGLKEYYEIFIDQAAIDFTSEGNIFAFPFFLDSLALYWNKDLFNNSGIPEPAKNWDEFLEAVKKLTFKDERGNILQAGAALGTSRNINSATDILSLLMLQTGTKMTNETKTRATFDQAILFNGENYRAGQAALKFYTDFANPQKTVYTWNTRMDDSITAFSLGKVAMIIDYSSTRNEILNRSPYLNFAIALLPQIKEAKIAVNYADYWGATVWAGSKNSKYAWQFIFWLAEKENLQKYLTLAKKPTSRRDLVLWQKDNPDLGVFASQSLSARSWYQKDNLAIKNIFSEMIESVILGQATVEQAIEIAANQVTMIMQKQ